jgi:peptidoglycan/xylan/chitin deacetylase (PgdA/CDA1 family)
MSRRIVCLTFDFDAVSGWISRGLTSPTPMSRGEFGLVGARRILALLAKYDIRSTWFVPGHTIESFPDRCEEVVAAGHEIAHHGWTHVPPANMTKEEEEVGLTRGVKAIKKLCGRAPRGYRSPSWDLSPHTVDLLVKHGFRYDSSMMGDDYEPYWARRGDVVELHEPLVLGKPTKLVEMPISWSLDDYPHFEFLRTPSYVLQGLMNARGVLQNWSDEFLYMTRVVQDWGVLTYTFHPFVIGRGHRMLILEKLITRLLEMNAAFLAMEDAVGEWLTRSGEKKAEKKSAPRRRSGR